MKQRQYQQGYGGIGVFVCCVIIGIIMYFYFYPLKFKKIDPTDPTYSGNFCSDIMDAADAPKVTLPALVQDGEEVFKEREYRMVKKDVPMLLYPEASDLGHQRYSHWENYFANYEDPKTHKKYIVRIPKGISGRSYEFQSSLDPGKPVDIVFKTYGILFLFHTTSTGAAEPVVLPSGAPKPAYGLSIADIYQAVDAPPLPEWVTHCMDTSLATTVYDFDGNPTPVPPQDGIAVGAGYELYYPSPTINFSATKHEEQLAWFLPKVVKYVSPGWWTPHCKPAIYLYPEKQTKVNVKVAIPSGEFLYTDPFYPKEGWEVTAQPNGELQYLGKELADSKGNINYASGLFPYLYYEGRIADAVIQKPTKGFVRSYEELGAFYDELLPKLGLNDKEAKEFKAYWLKALPKSPYYFIGVVEQDNLNEIEPLTITPKQDTTIRVSLYFQALDAFKVITPPTIQTPARNGFTVVEWGGMVKQDKDHPFTCVQ